MLKDFLAHKRVKLNAVVGLYPANAVGDDIEVYTDETRATVKAKFYGLRQQVRRLLWPRGEPTASSSSMGGGKLRVTRASLLEIVCGDFGDRKMS